MTEAYPFIRQRSDGRISIELLVQPRSSVSKIAGVRNGRLRVCVCAAPVDGEANKAVVELLSQAMKLPKSNFEIERGTSSKQKLVLISGLTLSALSATLDEIIADA